MVRFENGDQLGLLQVYLQQAILEIIPISMLPILLLIIASPQHLFGHLRYVQTRRGLQLQKHLEPLLPVLKRPEVAAFFINWSLFFFHMHLFIASIAIFSEIVKFLAQLELAFYGLWVWFLNCDVCIKVTTFFKYFLGVALQQYV